MQTPTQTQTQTEIQPPTQTQTQHTDSSVIVQNNNSVFRFADLNSIVTRDLFPSKCELNKILIEDQFNRLLQFIKLQINNSYLENKNFVRILNTQIQQYSPQIISDIKLYLQDKKYIITDIEDSDTNSIGWKVYW
jgi:hypothetical protein